MSDQAVNILSNEECGLGQEVSSCADNQSEAESISEEERVRKLFLICDEDGDGFIDR